MDTFLGSLVQSRCGEGGTLQTNNIGVCSQCLSHTGPAPAHSTHSSGSRFLHREPSEVGPGLHAPPRLRLRNSGSPQRRRLSWACVLCPSQVRVAQVFGERGCCDFYRLSHPCCSVFWEYNWHPSLANGDCPEPQEVLVSKEACLQFGS